MTLFKVRSVGRSTKTFCIASNLAELIETAKKKLNLPSDVDYQIALESDGCEIPDDEVLTECLKITTDTLTVIIFEKNSQLNEQNLIVANQIVTSSMNEGVASTSGNQSNIECSENCPHQILFDKIEKSIITKCQKKEKLENAEILSVVKAAVSYMINDLQDTRRKKAFEVAQVLCQKYSESFSIRIGNDVWSDGQNVIALQIYQGINYRKMRTGQTNSRKRISNIDDQQQGGRQNEKQSDSYHDQDEYGCVEYDPSLPEEENIESQEKKREKLVTLFENVEVNINEISKLMDETYSTIRTDINSPIRDFIPLFKQWPCLKSSKIFKEHASRLLGKNVSEIWSTSIVRKSKYIRHFFKNQKKNKAEMISILQSAKKPVENRKDEIPKHLVIFPLLFKYFAEKEEDLYKIIDKNASDQEMMDSVETENPILIIRGKFFYDEGSMSTVVINKEIAIPCDSQLDGILIAFLSYYVFGICYAPKAQKVLEMIQRYIFAINPELGSKSRKKRKDDSYDRKVKKLAEALEEVAKGFETLPEV